MASQHIGHHSAGLLAALLQGRQRLAPHLLQRVSREGWLAQQPPHQLDHLGQVLPHRGDVDRPPLLRRSHTHLGAQGVQTVPDLLAGESGATLVHQRGAQGRDRREALERLHITKTQRQSGMDHATARALGQERHLQARRQGRQLGAGVQVLGRGVEAFHLRGGRVASEVLQGRSQVHTGWRRGAVGLRHGQVGGQRTVVPLEVLRGHAVDVFHGHGTHMVAVQEEQAPIAARDGVRQRHAHALGVGEAQLPGVEPLLAHAFQLLRRDRLGGQAVDGGQQLGTRLVHVLPGRQLRAQEHRAGLGQAPGKAESSGSELLFRQALVQPASSTGVPPTRRTVTVVSPSCTGSMV